MTTQTMPPPPSGTRTAQDTTPAVAPLPAAKSPAGTGPTPLVAQLVALALLALGVAAVQHLLVRLGTVSGSSWLDETTRAADGLQGSSPLVLVAAVVALVLGVVLLLLALKPRPRRMLALQAESGVHLRRADLRRVVQAAVDDVDGVSSTDVTVRRRTVSVVAHSVAAPDRDAAIESTLRSRAEAVCATVVTPPRVEVTVRHEKGEDR
jgi:hypothetical protein